MYTYITEQCSVFLSKKVRKTMSVFFTLIIVGLQVISAQGKIVLEKKAPSETVVVTATQQVILKPGFRAAAANGNFNAKIGQSNSLLPTNLYIADGSTALIANIFVPGKGQNYIKTTTYLKNDQSESIVSYQYFDGFGRPIQTVQKGFTQNHNDLVASVEYDNVGREYKKWLPVAITGNAGDYVDINTISSTAQTMYSDSRPFSEIKYEPSPLNRVEEQFGSGQQWESNGSSTKMNYDTNDGTIAYFYVNSSNQLCKGPNYNEATLFVTKTTDEDDRIVTEFKDKLGQVILKRSSSDVDTYYAYNDLGKLCCVIPPEAAPLLINNVNDQTSIEQLCYQYQYDERGNCIYKRLPGCEPIYMVYDRADRLVLSQDGNQRPQNNWTVTKYDTFGRVLYTGVTVNATSHQTLISNLAQVVLTESVDNANSFMNTGYSCANYTPVSLLTVNYYDNYNFIPEGDMLLYDSSEEQNGYDAKWTSATGLLTGTRTYLLDNSGRYTTSAIYYNFNRQVVQSRASNYLEGYDVAYNALNFTGQITKTLKKHSTAETISTPLTELYTYEYDHALRPKSTTYSLNGAAAVTLASYSYDELGRIKEKKRHGVADTEQYKYNIRNWTEKIKSGTFEENMYYNANLPTGTTACYNGNIAYSTWTYSEDNNNKVTKGYAYEYDNLNRLREANSKQESSSQSNGHSNEHFTYDNQGNILTLKRWKDNVLMDNLAMHYKFNNKSNQLDYIDDASGSLIQYDVKEYQNKSTATANEFNYDANGNMTKDLDRNIVTIKYNLLNLPEIVQFRNGSQIINTYDASGRKLSSRYLYVYNTLLQPIEETQIYNVDVVNDDVDSYGKVYLGNFEYEFGGFNPDATHSTLMKVYNNEGYAHILLADNALSDNIIYYYYRKDHLGNNREVWQAPWSIGNTNYAASTVQRTQYYPSGLPWESKNGDNPGEQYKKYNGKEFVETHGLDEYDSFARMYYPAIVRTPTQDPHSENYYDTSPYAWCGNNFVNSFDPDGKDAWSTNDPNEISNFINALRNGESYDTSSWNHQTDEEYLEENSPNHFTYNDKTNRISVQWGSFVNGEFTMNSKSFSADKVKRNVIIDFIKERYNNPMDFITSPEGDAIISLIAGRIGVDKYTAVALFIINITKSGYEYNKGQISKQEMQNEIIQTLMSTGAGYATGIGGGFIFEMELYYLNEGAKKLNEFNKEFEIWINNLPKYWGQF